jgi:hypothetical protein
MSTVSAAARIRWATAAAAAALLLLSVMALFRMPDLTRLPAPPPTLAQRPAVEFVASPVVREETVLRDLAPLFLPTEWNVSLKDPPLPEPGKRFLDAETMILGFGDADLRIQTEFPPVVTVGGKPVASATPLDALPADAGVQPLLGMGRGAFAVPEGRPRGGYVEVVAMASGVPVLAVELPREGRPPTTQSWQPLQFLAAVEPGGLAGPLIMMEGSRVEEVNQHFRVYLMRTFRIGERLPPGFYRITVGP